jgi:hypothetical protein
MPVSCSVSIGKLSTDELRELDYRVMRHAFDSQNEAMHVLLDVGIPGGERLILGFGRKCYLHGHRSFVGPHSIPPCRRGSKSQHYFGFDRVEAPKVCITASIIHRE